MVVYPYEKKKKEPWLLTHTYSKWIVDLNLKVLRIIKLREENMKYSQKERWT